MDSNLEHLERYRVIEEVGRGGMAVVYRGRDRTLDRQVAIKVLHPHLASTPEARARFRQEARAVAKLHHRNIIEIFDFDDGSEKDGVSYIVTEFIEGSTLKQFMEDNKSFFPEIAALIAVEICDAISHAHQAGVIHRDLKPENMMITKEGSLKLMDFGIAKVIDQHEQMTVTGSILGSPAHMAPEMLEGRELDARSDLFSLGTILYWMATGSLPFTGTNPHQVLRRIIEGKFPDPQMVNPELGSDLGRIIKRALANDPEARFSSAVELRQTLLSQLEYLHLDSADHELEEFFEHPESYLEKLRPMVQIRLLERAKGLIASKDFRPALEDLDRLLAMVPGHPEALSLLKGLERRKRLVKIAAWSGGAAAALGIIFFGAWVVFHETQGHGMVNKVLHPTKTGRNFPDAGAPSASQTGDGSSTSSSTSVVSSAPDAGTRNKSDENRPQEGKSPMDPSPIVRKTDPRLAMHHQAKTPKVLPQPVQIIVQPYFQSVSIDGRQVAVLDDKNNGLVAEARLEPGPHKVVVNNDTCQTLEFTALVPKETRPDQVVKYRKRLKFKPATLVVDCSYPDALVFVDGKFKGTASDTKANPIVIPIEGRNPRPEVKLRLRHPKAGEMRTRLRVTAGRSTVRSVKKDEFVRGERASGEEGTGP